MAMIDPPNARQRPTGLVDRTAKSVLPTGCGPTVLNRVPRNVYAVFAGIFRWFTVGMPQDRAIAIVRLGAFAPLFTVYPGAEGTG